MILIGIDDTDTPGSRGTNQLAQQLVRTVLSDFRCIRIVRHQLLFDVRIPYTSKNGAASIWLESRDRVDLDRLFDSVRRAMLDDFVPGSDPGLCIACTPIDESLIEFGRCCQQAILTREAARNVAHKTGVRLEGLGGTNDGVIGALAAIGLAATGDDGRVVRLGSGDDESTGLQDIPGLKKLGVSVVLPGTNEEIHQGVVDVGKKLRPNLRGGRHVLFVEPSHSQPEAAWVAIKLP